MYKRREEANRQFFVLILIFGVSMFFWGRTVVELWNGQWLEAVRLMLVGQIGLVIVAVINNLSWKAGALSLIAFGIIASMLL